MLKGFLNMVVYRLIKDISIKVLGKRKLKDIDTIAINSILVTYNIFNRL